MLHVDAELDEADTSDGRDGSTEILYRTRRTLISRVRLPGSTESIICKKPLGSDAGVRLRHETRILERLSGIQGVPALASSAVAGSLAMLDVRGTALATIEERQRLDMSEVLDLAIELAQVVSGMHGRGVLHKDINPQNMLLAGAERRLVLIDFGLATTYAQQRPTFTHHRQIAGTLAYLAPEQSGRSGRLVDQRSDLYAVGVTLYELATGRLPFEQQDTLQLIHDHLVRTPRTPASIDASVPPTLSAIIMRLLEKEPDRRYQGADGLAYDLIRLKEAIASGSLQMFPLAERDFPSILLAPSRLIGREAERAILRDAFTNALDSPEHGIFVSGSAGVGKTMLVDTLRTIASEHRGWFVKGKFDQFQQGAAGFKQALSALGRLLLAESDEELAAHRVRIADALGTRAGRLTELIPEFAIILGSSGARSPDEQLEADVQIRQSMLDLFRAVATPARPLVVSFEDIQWAGDHALALIEAAIADASVRGLLIVGSYCDAEGDAESPLARTFARLASRGVSPRKLHLRNLEPAQQGALVAEILRLPTAASAQLSQAIGARTGGNPFDTVEFLNALRGDGILVSGPNGWTWDDAQIGRYVGGNDVVDFVALRIARLGHEQRDLLTVIACLGGDVDTDLLETALAANRSAVVDRLEAPLEAGLLLMERDGQIRFSHDRVQQVAYESIDGIQRGTLQLALARRLATVERYAFAAAEQYVLRASDISDPVEARSAIDLLTKAAAVARLSSSYAEVERFVAAAIALLEKVASASDRALLADLQSQRHAALYSLARYDEADVVYRWIEEHGPTLHAIAATACVQVSSLANRGLQRRAITVGMETLARLGFASPGADIRSEIARGLDELETWIDAGMPTAATAPLLTDQTLLLVARLTARVMPSAFFCEPLLSFWLGLQRQRLWREYGCPPALASGLVGNAIALIAMREDYSRAYRLARFARDAVGDTSEGDAFRTRHVFALVASHWREALDNTVGYAQSARDGLIAAGDLQFVGYTYFASLPARLDCGTTLDSLEEEAESAIAFAFRSSRDDRSDAYRSYRTLVRTLTGIGVSAGDESTAPGDASELPERQTSSPITATVVHVNSALLAIFFDEDEALAEHTAAAMPILPAGFYITSLAHVLRAYSLAMQVRSRAAARTSFARELRELDERLAWIVRRAADAPQNFLHLARFIEAERAWAIGDLTAACGAFELALAEEHVRDRPWHRALIAERAGRFFIERGLERIAGRALMEEARNRYVDWGAATKVKQLEARFPFLCDSAYETSLPIGDTTVASSDRIDLLAILRVSQALSSETSLGKLRARIVESLGAMSGASTVRVALFDDRQQRWFVSVANDDAPSLRVEDAAERALFPSSAFRYVERTSQPLLVEDATKDDRFATDPYLARLERCSLLVVPISSQGVLRAVLMLENELSTGTFTTDRLDAVKLVAGQLAVSIENASLYASLEETVAERTQALEAANRKLETLSITDALTGLANRRRFIDFFDSEWKRAQRTGDSLGLAIVDVDHFKSYNDRYGHLAGDACLQLVANEMNRHIREGIDLVARYGGEEFAIVLPGAGLRETRNVIERVRAGINMLTEPHASGERSFVTVSIGATAVVPQAHGEAQQLIAAADALLYRAKKSGRNRAFAEGDAPSIEFAKPAHPRGNVFDGANGEPL